MGRNSETDRYRQTTDKDNRQRDTVTHTDDTVEICRYAEICRDMQRYVEILRGTQRETYETINYI